MADKKKCEKECNDSLEPESDGFSCVDTTDPQRSASTYCTITFSQNPAYKDVLKLCSLDLCNLCCVTYPI